MKDKTYNRHEKEETMKIITGLFVLLGVIGFGVLSFAQADLNAFPTGSTKMVYEIVTEGMNDPQTLELVVVSHENERYTLSMCTRSSGTKNQLASFGFVFSAMGIAYGGGGDAGYSSLQPLIDQRSRLQEGEEYILPGGGSFTSIIKLAIAGVQCLEGSFIDPDEEDRRMTVAFALSHPVYNPPRIRIEELHGGEWMEVFRMELIEYTFTAQEG